MTIFIRLNTNILLSSCSIKLSSGKMLLIYASNYINIYKKSLHIIYCKKIIIYFLQIIWLHHKSLYTPKCGGYNIVSDTYLLNNDYGKIFPHCALINFVLILLLPLVVINFEVFLIIMFFL